MMLEDIDARIARTRAELQSTQQRHERLAARERRLTTLAEAARGIFRDVLSSSAAEAPPTKRRGPKPQAWKVARDYLLEHGPTRQVDIAQRAGVMQSTLDKAMRVRPDIFERVGDGTWRLREREGFGPLVMLKTAPQNPHKLTDSP